MKTWMLAGSGLLAWLFFSSSKSATRAPGKLAAPNGTGQARSCDPMGCGHYGAPRGSRTHAGVDFVVQPGQSVYSPVQGYLNRVAIPYASDTTYKGVEIIGTGPDNGTIVKIFYAIPNVEVGDRFAAGAPIAIAQDISTKYGSSMTPHIHVEVRRQGERVNPEQYF